MVWKCRSENNADVFKNCTTMEVDGTKLKFLRKKQWDVLKRISSFGLSREDALVQNKMEKENEGGSWLTEFNYKSVTKTLCLCIINITIETQAITIIFLYQTAYSKPDTCRYFADC